MNTVNPLIDLAGKLASVQNPARYLGGEYGQIKKDSGDLLFALAFPDLYEIAMSNLAVKVLYDGLNRLQGIRCERVFAPAPDFEALLRSTSIPLYTLESGIPICNTDIVGVSIGYEPGITGVLSILDSGGVPIEVSDRTEGDPIIIAGGCGVTNPAPFSRFIDAFFIGEAEAGLYDLVALLAKRKKAGATRSDLLSIISDHPSIWTAEKNRLRQNERPCSRRAILSDFGSIDGQDRQVCFPVPNLRIVQDHGSVEIMRGCPNGCRFCHAGMYYRPQRIKDPSRIIADVDFLVNRGGYREISLLSLSSGDYAGIGSVLDTLITRYSKRNISFQLPSLKVNTFTLPILEKLASVRKSGLTFAVETPIDAWQRSINKDVYRQRILDILYEAKKRGWSKAKFYFMVGLPIDETVQSEEAAIVDFLLDIQSKTRIQCNVNVGTFIPKPHTPYQWERQLSMDESKKKLDYVYQNLPKGKFKVSTHNPFGSFLEAILSRGDERVGELVLKAFNRGCRLDAWDDWAKPEVWKEVIAEADWDVEAETIRERKIDEPLPWDGVSLGPTKTFLAKEREKSLLEIKTDPCAPECLDQCGVCNRNVSVSRVEETEQLIPQESAVIEEVEEDSSLRYRVVLSFTKRNEAPYIPHLALLEIWYKAFARSELPVVYSEGFNPIPRLELAQSMSLGIASEDEIASFMLYKSMDTEEELMKRLNDSLPESLRVQKVLVYLVSDKVKRKSLSIFLWGNRFSYQFLNTDWYKTIVDDPRIQTVVQETDGMEIENATDTTLILKMPFAADRKFRDLLLEVTGKPWHEYTAITKLQSIAVMPGQENGSDFFTVFKEVAQENLDAQ